MKQCILICLVSSCLLAACTYTPNSTQNETQENSLKDTEHSSQNSLDWASRYEGVLPCADCEGIQTQIELFSDNTYTLSRHYLGKDNSPETQKGQFSWINHGNQIRLLNPSEPLVYAVQEVGLLQLSLSGTPIEGPLAKHYLLTKKSQAQESLDANLVGERWELTELMGKAVSSKNPPYIEFSALGNVSGFAGCNRFFGAYAIKGPRISFESIAMTMMACQDDSLEGPFMQRLQHIDNFSREGDLLMFYKARTAAQLTFKAAKTQ